MIVGEIRVDWGEEGEKSFVIGPGEIALFRRAVIHRAQIIDAEEDVRFMIVVREGQPLYEGKNKPDHRALFSEDLW